MNTFKDATNVNSYFKNNMQIIEVKSGNTDLTLTIEPQRLTPELKVYVIAEEDQQNKVETIQFSMKMGRASVNISYNETAHFWENVKRFKSGEILRQESWKVSHKNVVDWNSFCNALADPTTYPTIDLIFHTFNGGTGITVIKDTVLFHRDTEGGESGFEYPRYDCVSVFRHLAAEVARIESLPSGPEEV